MNDLSGEPAHRPGPPLIASLAILCCPLDQARPSRRRRDAMYATPPNNRTIALPAALGSSSGTPCPGRGGRRRRTCRVPPSFELLQPRLQAAASGVGATSRRPAASERTTSKRFIDISSNRRGDNDDYICTSTSLVTQVKFARKKRNCFIFSPT